MPMKTREKRQARRDDSPAGMILAGIILLLALWKAIELIALAF